MVKYVPLHLHTEYSLLDGAIRIPDLFKFAAENDMPAVAVNLGCQFSVAACAECGTGLCVRIQKCEICCLESIDSIGIQ